MPHLTGSCKERLAFSVYWVMGSRRMLDSQDHIHDRVILPPREVTIKGTEVARHFSGEQVFRMKAVALCVLTVASSLGAQESDCASVPHLGNNLVRAASGNGLFVEVSRHGHLLTSRDGIVWADESRLIQTFFRDVAFGGGVFVAVGGSYLDVPGVILSSHDGSNWVRRCPQNRMNLNSVAYGHGLFVAVGDEGTILTSPDGACWKKRRSGTSSMLGAVTFAHEVFVAGGESGTILTSTNGTNWTGQSLGESVYIGRILLEDGLFHVTNSTVAFLSTNGHEWSRREVKTAKAP